MKPWFLPDLIHRAVSTDPLLLILGWTGSQGPAVVKLWLLLWIKLILHTIFCYIMIYWQTWSENEKTEWGRRSGSQEGRGNKNNNLPLGWNREGDWWTDVFCHYQPSSVWNKGISNPANTVEHVCLLRMQGWLIFMSGIQTNFGNNGDWERGKDQQFSNSVAPLVHGATHQPSLWHPHCYLSRSFLLSFCDLDIVSRACSLVQNIIQGMIRENIVLWNWVGHIYFNMNLERT